MERIPPRLRHQWMPFRTSEILYCLTPAEYVDTVIREGLVPRFAQYPGLKAILMAYSKDPLYEPVYRFAAEGFMRQGQPIVRLHITTGNNLYRSLLPNRTYEVMSLDPIIPSDIVNIQTM